MNKLSEDSVEVTAVGIDVGDKRSQLCLLDKAGEIVEEATIPTTRQAFQRRFRELPRCRVVLETGTHANWAHDVLVEAGHEVIVANARKLRAISDSDRKSDVRDARTLAMIGQSVPALLGPVEVRSEQTRLDLMVVRARAAAVEARTALVNTVRGLAKSAGFRLAASGTARTHKLAIPESLEGALRPLMRLIEALSKSIAEYDKQIPAICRERYPQTALLTQVTGVGDLTALVYVLTVGDPLRFDDPRNVGAYLGITPRRKQSGDGDPPLRISKSGDRMMRTLLVQCAHHILRAKSPDSDLKRFGTKLASHGGKTAKKRAVVATARKLSVLLLALWRSGAVYQPLKNTAARG
jgi:transposase